jgi:hypothetical protein
MPKFKRISKLTQYCLVGIVVLSAAVAASEGEKGKWLDYYFTPRYMIPITDHIPPWSFDVEAGMVWGKGWFWGVEAGGGIHYRPSSHPNTYESLLDSGDVGGLNLTLGYGVNFGCTYDLSEDLQLAYGMFVGFWLIIANKYTYIPGRNDYEYDYGKIGSVGPFIRLRRHAVELSYRGIMAGKEMPNLTDHSNRISFGVINQFMLGYHFQTSKRQRRSGS